MTPLILAAAFSLITASDTAQTATTQQPAATAQKSKDSKDDPDHVVCRSEPVTGSRFDKRICMTRAQWDEQAKQSQESMQRVREQAGLGLSAGGGFSGH